MDENCPSVGRHTPPLFEVCFDPPLRLAALALDPGKFAVHVRHGFPVASPLKVYKSSSEHRSPQPACRFIHRIALDARPRRKTRDFVLPEGDSGNEQRLANSVSCILDCIHDPRMTAAR